MLRLIDLMKLQDEPVSNGPSNIRILLLNALIILNGSGIVRIDRCNQKFQDCLKLAHACAAKAIQHKERLAGIKGKLNAQEAHTYPAKRSYSPSTSYLHSQTPKTIASSPRSHRTPSFLLASIAPA